MLLLATQATTADGPPVARFALPGSGLELGRPTRFGAFLDVVGRRSALFGYENRGLEAWAWPLKLIDSFELSFRLQGYPLDIPGPEIARAITVRPEATVLTYSHPAFTVRHVLFAPIDEPALVMLLDIDGTLPMTVTGSFRPRLKLMWPAGLQTGDPSWDEKERLYVIGEETRRFVAVVGSPGARDLSIMPYQEEPRDVPLRFELDVPRDEMARRYVPIVIVGGVEGRDKARADYHRVLGSLPALYAKNVAYYRALQERTAEIDTPDDRLDTAFAWAKVGIDKGVATNPQLGTGLLAGFRTSGESERPGFAWFFGRDALWSALAVDSYGDFALTRTALDFLKKFQRSDGKVPHEISQSAALVPWFTDYPYPWNSADATPLYVIAHADHWRHTGDLAYLRGSWDSIVKAWRFTAASDSDGNGLVENTKFGHGWVEGGALYPPHEEIYMQGAWIEACRGLAEMARALKDPELAAAARASAERTRQATEQTYWLGDRGHYGYATKRPDETRREAEPGPNREVRQARLDELATAVFYPEDTVLPAVPLWWRTLDPQRAQEQIDRLGAGALATDWGHRLLSKESRLYDPLSYHYGSVWPLFTGWASVAAYRHGRPHVGFQALMANALLTFPGALGYVTELLSGDFRAAFGRSSHHQVWSEAMVVSPVMRGLLGIEAGDGGRLLTFAPQLPADWPHASARRVAVADGWFDLAIDRREGARTITVTRRGGAAPVRVALAPAFALDARIRSVSVDGRSQPYRMRREGDVQRAEVELPAEALPARVVFFCDEGTETFIPVVDPAEGAASEGLRILRATAGKGALALTVEGIAGREYPLTLRTPRTVSAASGAALRRLDRGHWELRVRFEGADGRYVRRALTLPLS
ncbi:MAG TPA: GH116 family glycosyl hydrolase [Vicinamibacteria bacterium]|nr:GH116 family glycosyl hydrolase [Vicinamibacteria bacterium]